MKSKFQKLLLYYNFFIFIIIIIINIVVIIISIIIIIIIIITVIIYSVLLFRQANCKLPSFREVYICMFKFYHEKEVSKKLLLLLNDYGAKECYKFP